MDADPSDGSFGTGSSLNSSTSADASSMFIIPKGPIFTYTCSDGGAHEWEDELLGSLSGYGVFVRFIAI